MNKLKFVREYEIKASPKILYPYISTATGLSEWFADEVKVDDNHIFNFIWDRDNHPARLTLHKPNKYVKFEFVPETPDEQDDPLTIEFFIETSDLTQSVYLRVVDQSATDETEQDLDNLWNGLVVTLREIVGG